MGEIRKLKINMVLPFPVTKPVGGAKIMYEYANRLALSGHDIIIYHSIKRPFKKSKTPLWLKRIIFFIRGVARPSWFPLNDKIKSVIVPEITNEYIEEADIVISTWWQMTYAVSLLSDTKGKKFNLIQDYEIWKGEEDKVDASFSLPVTNIVIAKYLYDLVEKKSGKAPIHIPLSIDNKLFYQKLIPANKNPHSIIMMYSEEKRKGTKYGLACLQKLKDKFPDLQVTLFGVYPKPDNLSPTFSYYQRPNNLLDLYNNAAIFVTPSLGEGWALPPAEAMSCGCAIVCTNIGGHLDYAKHNETALLFEPGNEDEMYLKIESLLNDNEKRINLANSGHQLITTIFNWEQSVLKMENCFYKSLQLI